MAVNDPTTNFGWLLPDPGASVGSWDDEINAVFGEDTGPPLGIDGILKNIEGGFLALDADNFTEGTVPDGRLSGSYTGITDITASGTVAAGNSSIGNQLIVATNSPAALSAGNNNNLDVGDATYIRLTPNASGSIVTGIAGGVIGRVLWVANPAAANITFTHLDSASSDGNKFLFPAGLDLTIVTHQVAVFIYDGVTNFWRLS